MCTLIIAVSMWAGAPLVVAANRDENLQRPAESPALRDNDGVRVLAPLDVQAGGTWLGVNAFGVFAGLTNRFTPSPNPQARSRGKLVLDALRGASAVDAADAVSLSAPSLHNPFHLLVADRTSAHLVWNDGHKLSRHRLQPGLHVLTERSLDAAPSKRLELLPRLVRPLAEAGLPTMETWRQLLSHRDDPPLEGVNVLDRGRNYGTRSSTVVQLSDDPQRQSFFHASGPPDETPYAAFSDKLRELLAAG
ncbi:MAG: NRDE family protein [Nannocystales bacterium]